MRALFAGLVVVLGLVVFAISFTFFGERDQQQAQQFGVPFELVDHNGNQITDAAFRGQPTAIFFGFTRCPEICPTTVFELEAWFAELGEDGENIDAYFITVDPERDTPEALEFYLTSITDRVVGITGDPAAVRAMVDGFSVYYKRVELDDGDYTMDHTASVFLLDSDGDFRKSIAYGERMDTAVAKLRDLADT
ncbi:MAG: SCO family protein [Pseudomonadota bacterium]